MTRTPSPALAVILLAALACLGCSHPTVLRLYDGTPRPGRFISSRAYALYASAAEAEARGDRPVAIRRYRLALSLDEDNVDAYAHLVGLHCSDGDVQAARDAYRQALERDAQHAETLLRWADCRRDAPADEALRTARTATQAAPEDERAVLLLVRALLRDKQDAQALVWLRGLLRRQPGQHHAWQLLATDEAAALRVWRRRARAALARLRPRSREDVHRDGKRFAAVDAALLRDDVAAARDLIREAGLAPAMLGLRALKLGQLERARSTARRRVQADPHDFVARVVLAWALDQGGDATAAGALLFQAPTPEHLDAVSRELMARLLARHIGDDGRMSDER